MLKRKLGSSCLALMCARALSMQSDWAVRNWMKTGIDILYIEICMERFLGLEISTSAVRADLDLELADLVALAAQHVAGFDRAHALRRAGVVNIARIERVERRGELDQPTDIVDQVAGLRGLLERAIERKRDLEVVRIGNFVGCHHPRTEHRITVDGFAEAAVLAAAAGHVEAEREAGDVIQGFSLRNVGAL